MIEIFNCTPKLCTANLHTSKQRQRNTTCAASKKRYLTFFVGCEVFGRRNWVYDLYKDGEFVSAAIGINTAKQFVPEFEG